MASFELFRRVLPVQVADAAGSDLLILALEAASSSPFAVLFPYRYLPSAGEYQEKYPQTPVLVIGGRSPKPPEETAFDYIRTDTAADLYRAGQCAALLAGADNNKRVLFFTDGGLEAPLRTAFQEGLKAREFSTAPLFINSAADYSSYDTIGCVVVAGPALKFLERNLQIPVILFSWTDPAVCPGPVKLVFDDSPWALAVPVIKSLLLRESPGEQIPESGAGETGTAPLPEEILFPSEPLILEERIQEKEDFRIIQEIIKGNFEKNEKKTAPESNFSR